MRTAIVLLITVALIALQFYFGMRTKKVLGALLPVGFLATAVWLITNGAGDPTAVLIAAAAFVAIWFIGLSRSKAEAQKAIDKMKAKDLDE
jgi:preprotein translocase subunit YajC